jgi:hypothetical protein
MSDHRGRAASATLLLLCAGFLLGSGTGGSFAEYVFVSPSADTLGARFGASIAAAGHTSSDGFEDLVVGAPGHAVGSGAVRVYTGQLELNTEPPILLTTLFGDQAQSFFGESVAAGGDVNGDGFSDVVVGAGRYDLDPMDANCCIGAAFVYHGSLGGVPNGDPTTADAQLTSDQNSPDGFGTHAAMGDVDNDGYADVILAADAYHLAAPSSDEGAVFVFHGSMLGVATPANASTADAQLEIGQSVANGVNGGGTMKVAAGDVDGDGYDDVIVGHPLFDTGNGFGAEGAVIVFLGGPDGIVSGDVGSAHAVIGTDQSNSPGPGAEIGKSVATGDVNGDGYDDVIVGAPWYGLGFGAVFVFHGGALGLQATDPSTAQARLMGDQQTISFGMSVTSGDVNGDGYDDVVVGDPRRDSDDGGGFVFFGSAAGVQGEGPNTAHALLSPPQAGENGNVGWRSAVADMDNDGFADVFLGAPELFSFAQSFAGAVLKLIEHPHLGLCGDLDQDEDQDTVDLLALRMALADPSGAALSPEGAQRCNVIAPIRPCDIVDVAVMSRELNLPPLAPGIADACAGGGVIP